MQLACCSGGRPDPTLRALPFHALGMGEIQHRGGLRYRQAPEAVVLRRRSGKKSVLLVTHGIPEKHGGFGVCGLRLSALRRYIGLHFGQGRLHGGLGAAQAHRQAPAGSARIALPAAGIQGQGLAAPAVQQLQGLWLPQGADQAGLARRKRQHLE